MIAEDIPEEIHQEIDLPTPRTQTKKQKRRIDDVDMIISDNTEDAGKLRKTLFQVFGGIFIAVFVFVMAQTVLEDVNFLGSRGSIKADSLEAIRIQDAFWKYFWDSNPELKKTKEGVTKTIEDTRKTIQELKALKQKAKESVHQFFQPDKINLIKNYLPENFSTKDLEALARKYGSNIEWILKANGLKNKEDIKKLDSLFIPKVAPKDAPKTLPTPQPQDSTNKNSR